MSAIPPLGLATRVRLHPCIMPFGTIASVVQFVVGIVVGASVAALLMIVIGPSRRVRAEQPLPPDVEAKLLLGEDPEQPTIPPPPRVDHPRQYTPNELAALQKLGDEQQRRKRAAHAADGADRYAERERRGAPGSTRRRRPIATSRDPIRRARSAVRSRRRARARRRAARCRRNRTSSTPPKSGSLPA